MARMQQPRISMKEGYAVVTVMWAKGLWRTKVSNVYVLCEFDDFSAKRKCELDDETDTYYCDLEMPIGEHLFYFEVDGKREINMTLDSLIQSGEAFNCLVVRGEHSSLMAGRRSAINVNDTNRRAVVWDYRIGTYVVDSLERDFLSEAEECIDLTRLNVNDPAIVSFAYDDERKVANDPLDIFFDERQNQPNEVIVSRTDNFLSVAGNRPDEWFARVNDIAVLKERVRTLEQQLSSAEMFRLDREKSIRWDYEQTIDQARVITDNFMSGMQNKNNELRDENEKWQRKFLNSKRANSKLSRQTKAIKTQMKTMQNSNSDTVENEKELMRLVQQKQNEHQNVMSSAVKRNVSALREFRKQYGEMRKEFIAFSGQTLKEMHSAKRIVTQTLSSQSTRLTAVVTRYKTEMLLRRKYFNQLQDVRGNIRVFARLRPLLADEVKDGSICTVLKALNDTTCAVTEQKASDFKSAVSASSSASVTTRNTRASRVSVGAKKTTRTLVSSTGKRKSSNVKCAKKSVKKTTAKYTFDKVFSATDDQNTVFNEASDYIRSVTDGYNVCIFSYGATGSGKTYTMHNLQRNALKMLFGIKQSKKDDFVYDIRVSVLEIYNEKLRDLLSTDEKVLSIRYGKSSKNTEKSKVSKAKGSNKKRHCIYVENLHSEKVENEKDLMRIIENGEKRRTVTSTKCNKQSSRSHLVMSIYVGGKSISTGVTYQGKLHLIDLAGSERTKKSGVEGDAMKEAQNINKSLSSLADVMSALSLKSSHIPFRNSVLTKLLEDSLGGNSKALMLVNLAPGDNNLKQSLSSLEFANKVKHIELGAVKQNKTNNN